MTKKLTVEIPEGLDEKEVLGWVKIKVERHLRAIEQAKVASVDSIIKPQLDNFDACNGLKALDIKVDDVKVDEKEI